MFATRRFQEDELVERCPTLELAGSDITETLRDYIFSSINSSAAGSFGAAPSGSQHPAEDHRRRPPLTFAPCIRGRS